MFNKYPNKYGRIILKRFKFAHPKSQPSWISKEVTYQLEAADLSLRTSFVAQVASVFVFDTRERLPWVNKSCIGSTSSMGSTLPPNAVHKSLQQQDTHTLKGAHKQNTVIIKTT